MSGEDSLWGGEELATLEEITEARDALRGYDDVLRTPMLVDWPLSSVGGAATIRLSLKMESLQTTGSFKIRGMRYKLHRSNVEALRSAGIVTLSAGNAGRAVAHLAKASGLDAKVFMPDTAPDDRKALMESLGASVVKVPGARLLDAVAACIKAERRILVHPFDDVDLIRGHASCGLEILEDVPDVVRVPLVVMCCCRSAPENRLCWKDVVVVCCGGGGLLAGVATAIKLSGSKARVVGVEPDGAQSMVLSVERAEASWCPDGGKTATIAHGLAPPFAGRACFNHVVEYVDQLVTVTDDEMRYATRALYRAGLVVEVGQLMVQLCSCVAYDATVQLCGCAAVWLMMLLCGCVAYTCGLRCCCAAVWLVRPLEQRPLRLC
jgi:threonine dehydratase